MNFTEAVRCPRCGRLAASQDKFCAECGLFLRDGLQSPSVTDPPVEDKLKILHLMESLGIETADVGLPGAGQRQREAVLRLCREIQQQRMRIRPNCAARTMMVDIQPIAEAMQLTGVAIEACVFIGSSPIRTRAESDKC